MAAVVGTAYVRLRAITSQLSKDIEKGLDKAFKDVDADAKGTKFGDDFAKAAGERIRLGLRDSVSDGLDIDGSGIAGTRFGDDFVAGADRSIRPGIEDITERLRDDVDDHGHPAGFDFGERFRDGFRDAIDPELLGDLTDISGRGAGQRSGRDFGAGWSDGVRIPSERAGIDFRSGFDEGLGDPGQGGRDFSDGFGDGAGGGGEDGGRRWGDGFRDGARRGLGSDRGGRGGFLRGLIGSSRQFFGQGVSIGQQLASGIQASLKPVGLATSLFGSFAKGLSIVAAGAAVLIPLLQGIYAIVLGLIAQIGFLSVAIAGMGLAMGTAAAGIAIGFAPIIAAFVTDSDALDEFKEVMGGVVEEWREFGLSAQDTLLPALTRALKRTQVLIPLFSDFAAEIGEVAGNFSEFFVEALRSETGQRRLGTILAGSIRLFEQFGSIIIKLGDVLSGVFVHALPIAEQFMTVLGDMLTRWAEVVRVGEAEGGGLAETFQDWFDKARLVFGALGDLFHAIWDIFSLGSTSSLPLFTNFAAFAEQFRAFTESPEGVERIKEIFAQALPVLSEIFGIITDVVGGIFTILFPPGVSDSPIISAFQSLRDALGVVIDALGPALTQIIAAFGGSLPAVMESLGKGLAAIAEALGPVIAGLAGAFGSVLPDILTTLGASIGEILTTLAPVLSMIVRTIGAELPPFLEALGTTLSAVFQTLGPVIAGLIATVGPLLTQLAEVFGQVLPPIIETLGGSIGQILETLGPAILILVEALGTALPPILETLGPALAGLIEQLAPLLADIFTTLGTVLPPVIEALAGGLGEVFEELGPAIVTVLTALGEHLPGVLEALGPALGSLIELFVPVLDIFIDLFGTVLPPLIDIIADLAEAFTPTLELIAQAVDDHLPELAEIFEEVAGAAGMFLDAFGGELAEIFAEMLDELAPLIPILGDAFLQVLNDLAPMIPDLARAFADLAVATTQIAVAMAPLVGPLTEVFLILFNDVNLPIIMQLVDAFVRFAEITQDIIQAFSDLLNGDLEGVIDFFLGGEGSLKEAIDEVGGAFNWFKDDVLPAIGGAFTTFKESAIDPASEALTWLKDHALLPVQEAFQFFKDKILPPIIRFFTETVVPAIEGIASAFEGVVGFVGGLIDALGDLFDALSALNPFADSPFLIGGTVIKPAVGSGGGTASANGRIVTSPLLTWVGEGNKPEVIIPLTNPRRAMQLAQESGLLSILAGQSGPTMAGAGTTFKSGATFEPGAVVIDASGMNPQEAYNVFKSRIAWELTTRGDN